MTHIRTPASAPALRPELVRLVDAWVLEHAAARDEGQRAHAFGAGALAATRRGELTTGQAGALAALLGLPSSCPANDR